MDEYVQKHSKEQAVKVANTLNSDIIKTGSIINKEYEKLSLDDYKKIVHSVTKDERKILYGKGHFSGYINSSNARKLNELLRNGDSLSSDYKQIADTLSDVIQKNTLSKDIYVTRYVKGDALELVTGIKVPTPKLGKSNDFFDIYNKIPEQIKSGTVYLEKGFLSTSGVIDKNVMVDKEIQMNIKVNKGTHCYVTTNYKESEVIFNRGTKIKILSSKLKYDTGRKKGILLDCIIEGD